MKFKETQALAEHYRKNKLQDDNIEYERFKEDLRKESMKSKSLQDRRFNDEEQKIIDLFKGIFQKDNMATKIAIELKKVAEFESDLVSVANI